MYVCMYVLLDYTAQQLSTQIMRTVATFKVDVESVLRSQGYTPSQSLMSLIDLIDSSINDAVAPFRK